MIVALCLCCVKCIFLAFVYICYYSSLLLFLFIYVIIILQSVAVRLHCTWFSSLSSKRLYVFGLNGALHS